MVKEIIYGAVASIVLTGFAYAMDQRIDQRVQAAINASEERRLESQLNFYIIKDETAGLTGEDRINQQIIERQLQKLRAQ